MAQDMEIADPLLTAATLLDIPAAEIGEDDDLFELGLDSLTVIRTASMWRRHGLSVSFEDLATEPTVRGWRSVLAAATPVTAPTGATEPTGDTFPLAPMQYAYWVGRQDGQPFGGVGSHFALEFDSAEPLDPARLQAAFTALLDRHPMLRVRILDDGTQQITDTTGFPQVAVHDVTDPDELGRLRDELSHRRMDPGRGEVVALAVIRHPGGSRLQVDLDMTVGDALSLAVLLDDLAALYADRELPPLGTDFPSYLRERGTPAAREEDARWWAERLPDLPRGPGLPVLGGAGPARMARHHHLLDAGRATALEGHARRRGLTPSAALTTAFAEVLAAWSDTSRFLLNLPLFTREPIHPDVDRLVGDFTGSVLLDADLSESRPFTEQARELQSRLHAAVGHSAYGGVDVLRDLARLTGSPVLAPVVHTSSLGLADMVSAATVDTFGPAIWVSSQNPQVWLDAQVREVADGILLNWDVRVDVLGEDLPAAMFDAYRSLVLQLAAGRGWDAPVEPAVPVAVRERTETAGTRLPRRGLHAAFFARARTDPDRPAVLAEPGRTGDALTYGELADRALRLAGALQARGVRPGDTVAISLPRGSGLVTAILGVLAAGAAYVPVAHDQPVRRRRRVLDRAGARLLLTDCEPVGMTPAAEPAGPGDPDAGPADAGPPVLDPETVTDHEPLPGPVPVSPDDLAYVLFTSGSTGEPKGVEVPHSAAVATIAAIGERFDVGPEDRTLLVSAPEFDLSVYDLFAPLSVGGAVVPLADDERRDPVRWWELVRRYEVTVWNTVPVLLDLLLTTATEGSVPLRLVLLGGDWVTPDLPRRLHAIAPGARFVALGGMTEAAIHSTVCEVDEPDPAWRAVPWGTPLDGVRCRVVDERGRDRPDLVPGELWVGGAGVARGYRGDPERTADRFVGHDGVRWYRSGDLARYLPDGSLDFLGRADHQVKVRGHRIELGEVEAALAGHPAVSRAVALVRDNRIVAAVAGTPDPDALAAHQAELLPEVMRADPVLVLDALPLTVNGKPDRAAVRALFDARGPSAPVGAPALPGVEERVAAVWAEVLGLDAAPARTDGFFAVGGDSLLATRMLAALTAAGLRGGRLGALFGSPALADFAATLTSDGATADSGPPGAAPTDGAAGSGAHPAIVADVEQRHEPFPTTDVQAAYVLGRDPAFTLGGVGTWQYAEFDGPEGTGPGELDLVRLAQVWDRLVARHEMLRAVVDPDGRQRILPSVPPVVIDVTDGDPDVLRTQCSHRLLDLSRWPLHELRAVRYTASGETRVRLAIGLDYLLFDALSIMTLFTELDTLYADPAAELAPIDLSFRDYVLQVHPDPAEVARDEEHWRTRLSELPAPPRLPLRVEPAAVERPRFTRRTHLLPPSRWAALTEKARAAGLTPSTALLAAYTEVLAAWSEQPELTVTLTLFNRKPLHPDVFRVLGDFTSLTLADHRPAGSWLATARGLQRRLGTDLDHREASPAWLLRELAARTGTLDSAAPVVFTSALGVGDGAVGMDMPHFPPRVFGISQSPQVSLDNQVLESAGGLQVTWDAVDELFREGVLDAMFTAYIGLLDHLATQDWGEPLPDLLPVDQRTVREKVNETGRPFAPGTLHDPFFAAAADRGGAPALLWDGGSLTHAELADRALRVAADLVRRGIRPGDTVAVSLPKGPDQVVAVLGVLAAGGCYVPVGVDQPPVRRQRVHEAAGVRHVLDTLVLAAEPLAGPLAVSPDAPAYVIFTSGSTGAPKGVQVRHAAAANTVADVTARFGVGPADRVLAVSALDFDLSVFDVFGILGAGGALVLPTEDDRRDAARWRDLCVAHGVTVWNTVPTLLEMLLVAGLPPTLRLALVSGDRVPTDLHVRLGDTVRLVAMGGATEGAIWSNVYEPGSGADLTGWACMPYGTPLTAQRYRVVGPDGRDRPDWVPGELWIGGRGVADGYRGDPGRTAERFVVHRGERWYRTGDVGRYRPDGLLEFLGRLDQQIKISGHRLELGEVEAALMEHPEVKRAVVVTAGPPTARRLHAFVTGAAPAGLHAFLTERVPAHAIPGALTELDALPLTANGKVDRAELTRRAETDDPAAGAPPEGPTETALAALWVELLELPDTPPRDLPFFTAGGSSLGALRLLAAVHERFGAEVPARRFLAAPTLAALAAEVDALCPIDGDTSADQETGTL